MMADLRYFVIHTTDVAGIGSIRDCLNANGDYRRYYDGWESTVENETLAVVATRLYYYDIPKLTLTQMVRHLQVVRQTTPIAGLKVKFGNMEELRGLESRPRESEALRTLRAPKCKPSEPGASPPG